MVTCLLAHAESATAISSNVVRTWVSPNETEVSYRHRRRAWLEVKVFLVIGNVNAQRVAVSSTAWLDDTLATKPFFQEIMCVLHLSLLFWCEVIAAKSFYVLEGVEQLKLLICVSKDARIHT